MQRVMAIDLETYSDVDLVKCGVYAYADSPAFEVLLFAYAFEGDEVTVVDLAQGELIPAEVLAAVCNETVIKTAFNANFERTCLSKHLGRTLLPESWHCSAVQAAMLALPRSLEDVGMVLGLEKQKMKEGRDLIRYFCMPCKPTKANEGRTRNLPGHAPEKWELFKQYCKRDVEVETAIRHKVRNFPVSEKEMELYHLDQEINDRGVLVDRELVEQAVSCDLLYKDAATKRAYELTGLENPNSVAQLKGWLEGKGLSIDSLSKQAVGELLTEADGEVEELLRLRLLMAKTSVKKYQAIERSVCSDGRVHGLLQFYGANRTGRWAGRLVQVQNLPQNHLADLELARNLIKAGRYEDVEMLYDSIPNVLSELIRTAFIPKPGCRFLVADFSAIEARVLAWLSGEQWRLDVFSSHGRIYEASASAMFHVPIEEITKGSPLRQKGKISELACIAEGSLVLTDGGLIPIEDVTKEHLLWDGVEWVNHGGVVYKGERKVIEYAGLSATEDHLVWVSGKSEPVYFGEAARSGACLLRTGNGRKAIRVGKYYFSRETLEQNLESLLCTDKVYGLRKCTMAAFRQSSYRAFKRMPGMFPAKKDTAMAGQKAYSGKAKMRKSQCPELQRIRRPGNPILFSVCLGSRDMGIGKCGGCKTRIRIGPYRQQWKLRAWKYPFCKPGSKPSKQAKQCTSIFQTGRVALCQKRSNKDVVKWYDKRTDYNISARICKKKKQGLAVDRGTARVYDIRDAGPRNRFTVSGCLVHNCGYGGGVGALKSMGALEMGVEEAELQKLIHTWRTANPNITKFWWDVDTAAIKAFTEKRKIKIRMITFEYKSGILFAELPSGRRLAYVKPRMAVNKFGRNGLTYEGISENGKWGRIETYGPKLVENIVQGTARDLLAEVMLRMKKMGYSIVMHVHDEVVLETPDGKHSVEEVCAVMAEQPEWAIGLPLRADGYECTFYKKD